MTVCDTNILFPALEASHPDHRAARAYLESRTADEQFALCELILVETYTLLRNPAVCARPMSAKAAVQLVLNLRQNPAWITLDYPGPGLMERVWESAASSDSFRRIYDVRLAHTLRHYRVTHFATSNVKHFQGFGFEKVWNPLVNG